MSKFTIYENPTIGRNGSWTPEYKISTAVVFSDLSSNLHIAPKIINGRLKIAGEWIDSNDTVRGYGVLHALVSLFGEVRGQLTNSLN